MEHVIDPQGQRLFRYDLIDILKGARAPDARGRSAMGGSVASELG
jgi:hypothetical protein